MDSLPDLGHHQPSDPFVVRGHHATRLYNIIAMGMTVDDVIEMTETEPEPYKGYDEDVFGSTEQQRQKARDGLHNYFQTFLDLPDDHPVRFVAAQKDGICDSCAIGSHCDTLPAKDDNRYIRTIGKMAKDKGIEDAEVVTMTPNGKQKNPVFAIELSAHAAKQVLGDLEFHSNTYPALFRPIVRAVVRADMRKIQK